MKIWLFSLTVWRTTSEWGSLDNIPHPRPSTPQYFGARPNFINLKAEKIPGYETFTLDEHIRWARCLQNTWEMFIRAKPDVIHYVDSPEISERQPGTSGQYLPPGQWSILPLINQTYKSLFSRIFRQSFNDRVYFLTFPAIVHTLLTSSFQN